jgi:PhnB protein
MVDPIPEGYHTVTPYLIVEGADELIEFVKQAFGGQEQYRMAAPDGSIGHAQVQIGDSVVMLADASEQYPATSSQLHLYVGDCDATYRRALEAGASPTREPTNEFYGDRTAVVTDPVGITWSIATHVEDVPEEEMARRAEEAWAARQS